MSPVRIPTETTCPLPGPPPYLLTSYSHLSYHDRQRPHRHSPHRVVSTPLSLSRSVLISTLRGQPPSSPGCGKRQPSAKPTIDTCRSSNLESSFFRQRSCHPHPSEQLHDKDDYSLVFSHTAYDSLLTAYPANSLPTHHLHTRHHSPFTPQEWVSHSRSCSISSGERRR